MGLKDFFNDLFASKGAIFLQSEKMKEIIIRERKKEREIQLKIKNQEIDDLKRELSAIHNIIVAEKDADIYLLEERITELEKQIKKDREAYDKYYSETVFNKKIISEVASQIEKLFSKSGEIYGSFSGIKSSMDRHYGRLIENDSLLRTLFGIPTREDLNDNFSIENDESIVGVKIAKDQYDKLNDNNGNNQNKKSIRK